jgi:effector-binding domain-containing protein
MVGHGAGSVSSGWFTEQWGSGMFDEPFIEQRDEQPYVALSTSITMQGFGVIGPMFAELFDWLAERGITPAGPPFIRYLVIDMENLLDIEVAIPVAVVPSIDGRVVAGTLPGGSYVTLNYSEDGIEANAHLQRWARDRGLRWKNSLRDGRELWGGRIEISTEDGGDSTAAYLIEDE